MQFPQHIIHSLYNNVLYFNSCFLFKAFPLASIHWIFIASVAGRQSKESEYPHLTDQNSGKEKQGLLPKFWTSWEIKRLMILYSIRKLNSFFFLVIEGPNTKKIQTLEQLGKASQRVSKYHEEI